MVGWLWWLVADTGFGRLGWWMITQQSTYRTKTVITMRPNAQAALIS